MPKIRAAVLLPEKEKQNPELILRCLNYITARGYVFDSIVSDLAQLMKMREEGIVQVVVYARPEHMFLTGLPQFELATDINQEQPAPAQEEAPTSTRSRRRDRRPKIVS